MKTYISRNWITWIKKLNVNDSSNKWKDISWRHEWKLTFLEIELLGVEADFSLPIFEKVIWWYFLLFNLDNSIFNANNHALTVN